MPYFTAASVVRFYVFRGIFFVGHTLPQCKRLYTYRYRIVRLSIRRRTLGTLTVTLCCIHVVHLNTLLDLHRYGVLYRRVYFVANLYITQYYGLLVLYGLFRGSTVRCSTTV